MWQAITNNEYMLSGMESPAVKSVPQHIDLFFSPAEITEEKLKGYKAVVVIDVLRTATTIAMALSNGARDVIPAASVSAATQLSSLLSRDDLLLCGERDGKMIDGFHIGNSPADYTRERVRGRRLVLGSTNGTPAIVKSSGAPFLVVCAWVNLPTVVDVLLKQKDRFPLAILCAGKNNRFAIEDAVCGGDLIEKLALRSKQELQLNDAARVSRLLKREYGGDIQALLRQCDHGKYLISIGMEPDLALCASSGVLPVVPVLADGKLVKWGAEG